MTSADGSRGGAGRSAGWRHRHTAVVGSRTPAYRIRQRCRAVTRFGWPSCGYKAALARFDVDFDPSLVLSVTADQEGGYGAAAQVLATGATGVFCHNDRTALGLYDALRESGKRMPDDISVVGFDNQEVISAHMHPALTTVGLPQYDLGVMGVRTLLRRCGADNDESEIVSERFEPVHVQCPAVPRDSVRTL